MDLYVSLPFRQILVVVYITTSNFPTYSMHEPRQNQTSHYSRENRYFYLSVAPWSRTKIYKLQVQKEKPAVFASHPHMVGPARRSSGNACGVAFSLTSGTTVEQTDYRQTPTPPTARWLG